MLNQTTMLRRVGIPMVAIGFMVGSRPATTRGITSAQGIEVTPDLIRRLSAQTSNYAINLSTTDAGAIQAGSSNDINLIGGPPLKPSTKPPFGRDKTKTKQPNPTLNRTHRSVLRPLPHAG